MRQIILVDVDGTLCKEVCFTEEQARKATPNLDLIKKINSLYEQEFIVIYTARRTHLIEATMRWLELHGVKYHAISNHKIPGDTYIDADTKHPKDL